MEEYEKLIIYDIDGETIDTQIRVYCPLGVHFYCIHNGLKIVDEILEFEAFVLVPVQFK